MFSHMMLAALLKIPLLLDACTTSMGEQVTLKVIVDKLNVYASSGRPQCALIAGCLLSCMCNDSSTELACGCLLLHCCRHCRR